MTTIRGGSSDGRCESDPIEKKRRTSGKRGASGWIVHELRAPVFLNSTLRIPRSRTRKNDENEREKDGSVRISRTRENGKRGGSDITLEVDQVLTSDTD